MLIFKSDDEIKNQYEVLRLEVPAVSPPLPFDLLCAKKNLIKNRVVEIPLCGVTWQMPHGLSPAIADYSTYPQAAALKKRRILFDEVSLSYYFFWQEDAKQFISFFDTDETLSQKCRYAEAMGAAGILIWPKGASFDHVLQKLIQY
jgi:GH18 family chitinase